MNGETERADLHGAPVLIYRWIVFLLAGAYTLYQIATADYAHPGGPFRFLTIWALVLSFYSASRMLAYSEHRSMRRHHIVAMCAAVVNAMVVFLYWKLHFSDPSLVNASGPPVWHQEYYLHGIGPALQIFDALFIARAFRAPWRAIPWLLALIAAYVAWAELFVQQFNSTPQGSITSGLPYPFLNSMELPARAGFYVSNAVISVGLLGIFAGIMWASDRMRRRQFPTAP